MSNLRTPRPPRYSTKQSYKPSSTTGFFIGDSQIGSTRGLTELVQTVQTGKIRAVNTVSIYLSFENCAFMLSYSWKGGIVAKVVDFQECNKTLAVSRTGSDRIRQKSSMNNTKDKKRTLTTNSATKDFVLISEVPHSIRKTPFITKLSPPQPISRSIGSATTKPVIIHDLITT